MPPLPKWLGRDEKHLRWTIVEILAASRQDRVERPLAWLTAHRRLALDYERHPRNLRSLDPLAAINQVLRRLTRGRPARRQQRRTLNSPG
ncbi:hypothetical protein ACIBCR_01580 [Micromonospora echinospora]|uniref:hypothetical protein n=1 Tax=Micromonospora echinospora TaxID=1877 RepID=UPI0037AC9DE2